MIQVDHSGGMMVQLVLSLRSNRVVARSVLLCADQRNNGSEISGSFAAGSRSLKTIAKS